MPTVGRNGASIRQPEGLFGKFFLEESSVYQQTLGILFEQTLGEVVQGMVKQVQLIIERFLGGLTAAQFWDRAMLGGSCKYWLTVSGR